MQLTKALSLNAGGKRLTPASIANLSAWYDVSSGASTTSDVVRIDSSNRVSLIADRSGNSAVNCFCSNVAASQTMTAANKSVTGNQTFTLTVGLDDYTPGADQILVNKLSGNDGFSIVLLTTGVIRLRVGNGASVTNVDSNAANTLTDRAQATIGIVWTDGVGASFTQNGSALGTAVAAAVTLTNAATSITIGSTTGRIYRVQIGSVYDCNPALATTKLLANGATFSSGGDTWTLNSSGDLGARICGERDLVQLSTSKQPIYLAWAGSNYGYIPGLSGGYYSTPDAAANSPTTAFDFVARVRLNNWASGAGQVIASKHLTTGNQRSFRCGISATGTFYISASSDGATDQVNNNFGSALGFAANSTYWLRWTYENNVAGNVRVTGYYAADTGDNTPPSSWTQHAQATPVAAQNIFDGTAAFTIAGNEAGTANLPQLAVVHYAELLTSVGGAATVSFNPALYTSGTTFTASTGETWTLNGGSTIVTRTCCYFDGSDDYMRSALFSMNGSGVNTTGYIVGSQVSWTDLRAAMDLGDNSGSGLMQLRQNTSTPNLGFVPNGGVQANNNGLALQTGSVVSFGTAGSGGSTFLRINRTTAATGTHANVNIGAVCLGARWATSSADRPANITFCGAPIYSAAHDTTAQDTLVVMLGNQYQITV